VIFSLTLICILRRVFEQLVNSRAVTVLRYTRCNIVILMVVTAWLCPSVQLISIPYFSSVPRKGTLEKYVIRIKSAHDTGTEGKHQPRSWNHQNNYVTSGIPQHD
jgi:hypothetical protein